jgi:hypothetical protein
MISQQVFSPHGLALRVEIAFNLMSAIPAIVLEPIRSRTERVVKQYRDAGACYPEMAKSNVNSASPEGEIPAPFTNEWGREEGIRSLDRKTLLGSVLSARGKGRSCLHWPQGYTKKNVMLIPYRVTLRRWPEES